MTQDSAQLVEDSPLKKPVIALVGNPNSGKTSLFNALTGLRHKVANYPGVTVERREGSAIFGEKNTTVLDLPGIYSLSTHAPDEAITTDVVCGVYANEPSPDLILCVIDATNVERNLFLATQLIDLGQPIILVLNMIDLAVKRGHIIHVELLRRLLGIPVVAVSASKGEGLEALKQEVDCLLRGKTELHANHFTWAANSKELLNAAIPIGRLVKPDADNNLATVMGLTLLSAARTPPSAITSSIDSTRISLRAHEIDPLTHEASARYRWIHDVCIRSIAWSIKTRGGMLEKIDWALTHKIWGSIVFIMVMTLMFQGIFLWAALPMEVIDHLITLLGQTVSDHLPAGILRSLIVDGIISGVGSVLIFIPQIALLFLFLGILEDSGYLARAAYLMDGFMRRVGLQGRSFIPLLSSFACAIPGIMATRTIPSLSDRLTTIFIAPFMSCSARLPVYTLLIAACIPNTKIGGVVSLQGFVLLSMYLLGIIGAALTALLLKRTVFRSEPALFVMELPPFRLPAFTTVIRDIVDRVFLFLKSAGTVILACSIILWALATFPRGPIESTAAGRLGKLIEPAIAPLGFNWEIGIGLLSSFAAREVFVSSLATVYRIQSNDDDPTSLIELLKSKSADGTFSVPTSLSLMVFYVFACQCMSTLAVCRKETGSWRWPIAMFAWMTLLAYAGSLLTYNFALYFASK